jgi:hypothetical protein
MNTRIFDNSLCMSFCRRSWLKAAWGALGFASTGFSMQSGGTRDWALTKEEPDRLTPDEVITQMKLGNERRYRALTIMSRRSAPVRRDSTQRPSYSAALIHELLPKSFWTQMGNLTGLLARVKPAITATVYADEKSSKSEAYVDAVARTNVLHAIGVIRQRSKILALLKTPSSIRAEALDQIRTVGTLDPIRSRPSCSRFSLTATRAGSLKSWVLKESSIVAEREG